ncbi:MAG: Mur ligase family protein [Candidatus Paceibacterota bacterium]|jgi:UDP-N-acetylmuramoyl-tripeptide--D-alanyl-D-alanine ligase
MKAFLKETVVRILEWESLVVLKKYKPKIIAVTGNVGKTTTKDAIAAVLNKHFFLRKSDKSFNSEIGVPLTVLGCKNAWLNPIMWLKNILEGLLLVVFPNHYPDYLILEIGTDKPGDIKRITKWLSPDIVVVNKIGDTPVHIEFFSSVDELIKEKFYLVRALKKDGVLIVNGDDANAMKAKDLLLGQHDVSFGMSEGLDVQASNYHTTYDSKDQPIGIAFKIDYMGNNVPVRIRGMFGKQNLYPVTAAVGVGLALGLNLVEIASDLSEYDSPRGRLKLIEGANGSTIFDDTFNSSPAAAKAALDFMGELKSSGRKICVLGDMLELGKYTAEAHRKIGAEAAGTCEMVLGVGHRSLNILDGAADAGMDQKKIKHFDDSVSAGKWLRAELTAGDTVLVKGSQSMRMERAVLEIMKYPENRSELLVRQDKEWLAKEFG